jgi:hypothetical protein
MKVLVAAVCDHSWVENGCLTLCRAFDSVNAVGFPFTLARISVGLRLLILKDEFGEHKLSIVLADQAGNKLMESLVNMNFHPPQEYLPQAAFSFALNGQNITFPKAGDYSVNISLDGKTEASIPLYVRQNPSPAGLDIPDRI